MRNLFLFSLLLSTSLSYADDVKDLLEIIESGVTVGDMTCAEQEPVVVAEVPYARRCSLEIDYRNGATVVSMKKGGVRSEELPLSRVQEIKDRLTALVNSGECVVEPSGTCRIEPFRNTEIVVKVGRQTSYLGAISDIAAARANLQSIVDSGLCTVPSPSELPACELQLYDNGDLRLQYGTTSTKLARNPTREQVTTYRENMTVFRENNVCSFEPVVECRLNRYHSCRFSQTAPECVEGVMMLEMNETAVFSGTPEEMKARAAVIADLGLCTLHESLR